MRKTLVDYIPEAKYARYTELLDMAEKAKAEYKASHKAERKPRGPLTQEQLIAKKKASIAKMQAQLNAMLGVTPDSNDGE